MGPGESWSMAGRDAEVGLTVRWGWEDVKRLPPLPRPHYTTMNGESACGCTLVLVIIFVLVTTTEAIARTSPIDSSVRSLGLTSIYTEAAVAVFCLLGLLFGDSGTLKRTPERCFPLPKVVEQMLEAGKPLMDRSGAVLIENQSDGRDTYCVRCRTLPPTPTQAQPS